jgi:signal transduction histidine kinase
MTAMTPFEEMKAWVGFTPVDEVLLRQIAQVVDSDVERIIDHFYEKILESPSARRVLADDDQVQRLKSTLRVWLRELLSGPWDDAYFCRRERIGHRHVDVGLHSRYMFTAMSVITQDLCELLHERVPPGQLAALCDAVLRITALDLAIMTGTYVKSRERQQLAVLQSILVENLQVTVLLVGHNGRVAAATRTAARLFGDTPVLDRPWQAVFPEGWLAASGLQATVARALSTGRDITLLRIDLPEGTKTRSLRVNIVPLKHEQAEFMLQIEELTDAVQLEGRLRRAEALAQLGSMSAAVAHELRNPLAGISGAVQVMAASMSDDVPYKPIMKKVEQEIGRLDRLVTDLMAFARPSGVRLEALDLKQQAQHVVDLIRADHPQATLEIVGEGAARGDAHLVQQIALNLVQNALQAAGPTAHVRVDVRERLLRVLDNGPGVPSENVSTIFEPFFTTKTRGTGLGLAISLRNAQAMQGHLRLVPSPLGGAGFELELPEPLS